MKFFNTQQWKKAKKVVDCPDLDEWNWMYGNAMAYMWKMLTNSI